MSPGRVFLGCVCVAYVEFFFFYKKYRAEFRGCERAVQHLYAVVCMWPAKHRLCSEVMFCFHEVQTWHLTRQNVTTDSTIQNKSSSFTVCVCACVCVCLLLQRSGEAVPMGVRAHPSRWHWWSPPKRIVRTVVVGLCFRSLLHVLTLPPATRRAPMVMTGWKRGTPRWHSLPIPFLLRVPPNVRK